MVTAVIVAMFGACMIVRHFVMVRGFEVHGLVRQGAGLPTDLVLQARATDWTQHGSRHRTPQGKQHGEQQQEPDAKSFHQGQVSTRCVSPVQAVDLACEVIVNLAAVARSRGFDRLPGESAAAYSECMKTVMLTTVVAALALSESAAAQMVPIDWDASGQFSKEVAIAPGKFVEACEKLPKGAKVAWSFDAPSPLEFNIHFHEGKQVRFPAKKNQVAKDAGTLNTKVEQDYCWMWTNKGAAETTLNLKLTKG